MKRPTSQAEIDAFLAQIRQDTNEMANDYYAVAAMLGQTPEPLTAWHQFVIGMLCALKFRMQKIEELIDVSHEGPQS